MGSPRYVLFTAIPFVGHLNPLMRQAAELARRGWRVAVAVHEEVREHVEGVPGVAYLSLGSYGNLGKPVEQIEAEVTENQSFLGSALALVEWLEGLWPSMFDGLRLAVGQDRPEVIVADLFAINAADLLGSLPQGLYPPADHLPLPLAG